MGAAGAPRRPQRTALQLADCPMLPWVMMPPPFTQLHQLVQQLKASGALASNVTDLQLRTCVYGRTNTALYEHRPKVSLLMQYFKR